MIVIKRNLLKKNLLSAFAIVVFILTIVACGGGGGGGNSVTAINSPVNLSAIKAIEEVTAAPGTVMSFKMTGTVTDGKNVNTLSGTLSAAIKQPVTIEGQIYNVKEQRISITNTTTNSLLSTKSTSFISSHGSFELLDTGVTRTITASSQKTLSATAAVGDSGTLGTVSYSDGQTQNVMWQINPAYNGDAILKLSFDTTDNLNSLVYREEDNYTIMPDGTISALTVKMVYISTGITINLSGNRFYAIYGKVTDPNGMVVSGVTININQGPSSQTNITTDANGDYIISSPQNGPFTLTPSCSLTTSFTPANRTATFNNADVVGMDFIINDTTSPLTNDATAVADVWAKLSGTYSNFLGEPMVWVEYGTTANYGNTTFPFPGEPLYGTLLYRYTTNLTGLAPLTTYHYRLVTRINWIYFYGEDKTFTTLSSPLVLATGLEYPVALAMDGTSLYWRDFTSIKKVGKTGGAVTTLVSGLNGPAGAIAIDSMNVYWLDDYGSLKKAAINGGPATVIVPNGVPSIELEGTDIYWPYSDSSTYLGGINKVGVNGGEITSIVKGLSSVPSEVVVYANAVYWSEDRNPGSIKKFAINSGILTTVVVNESYPRITCVDSSNVYWSASGLIKKTGLNGGAVTTLSATAESIFSVTQDSTNVYWIGSPLTGSNDAYVRRIGKNGGPVTTLATIKDPSWNCGLAVDDTNVYWIEPNFSPTTTGYIIKALPKK